MVKCNDHKSYLEHIQDQAKTFSINRKQILNIVELVQYTILYTISCLYVGSIIDSWFKQDDLKKIGTGNLLLYICIHMIVSMLAVYFIRKFVQFVPFIGENIEEYVPHCDLFEFEGEITIGIIFIATQRNLLANVDELYNRINF